MCVCACVRDRLWGNILCVISDNLIAFCLFESVDLCALCMFLLTDAH